MNSGLICGGDFDVGTLLGDMQTTNGFLKMIQVNRFGGKDERCYL